MFSKEAISNCPLHHTTACFRASPTASESALLTARPRLSYASNTSPEVTTQVGPGPCSGTQRPGTATAEPHFPRTKPAARTTSPRSSLEIDAGSCWLSSLSKEFLSHLVALVFSQGCRSRAGSAAPRTVGQDWPRSLPSPAARCCIDGCKRRGLWCLGCWVWVLFLNPALSPLQSCRG